MIYLDNAATTDMLDVVKEEVQKASFFNPSSAYADDLKNRIGEARQVVADYIGAKYPEQIVFTSGASEGNSWVLNKYNLVISSRTEHSSIINQDKFIWTKLDENGMPDVNDFEHLCTLFKAATFMAVNNETGVVNPIKTYSNIANDYGVDFGTDITQALTHVTINVSQLKVDWAVASGHKIGAPKGIGFVYLKNPDKWKKYIAGEQYMRGGTYNYPGIIGLSTAIKYHYNNAYEIFDHICKLKFHLYDILKTKEWAKINCDNAIKSPHIVNFQVKGVRGEELVTWLAMNDIYVSTGSACNSENNEPSHVLKAIGLTDEEANSSIRVSFSHLNTNDEIDQLIEQIENFRNIKGL